MPERLITKELVEHYARATGVSLDLSHEDDSDAFILLIAHQPAGASRFELAAQLGACATAEAALDDARSWDEAAERMGDSPRLALHARAEASLMRDFARRRFEAVGIDIEQWEEARNG